MNLPNCQPGTSLQSSWKEVGCSPYWACPTCPISIHQPECHNDARIAMSNKFTQCWGACEWQGAGANGRTDPNRASRSAQSTQFPSCFTASQVEDEGPLLRGRVRWPGSQTCVLNPLVFKTFWQNALSSVTASLVWKHLIPTCPTPKKSLGLGMLCRDCCSVFAAHLARGTPVPPQDAMSAMSWGLTKRKALASSNQSMMQRKSSTRTTRPTRPTWPRFDPSWHIPANPGTWSPWYRFLIFLHERALDSILSDPGCRFLAGPFCSQKPDLHRPLATKHVFSHVFFACVRDFLCC